MSVPKDIALEICWPRLRCLGGQVLTSQAVVHTLVRAARASEAVASTLCTAFTARLDLAVRAIHVGPRSTIMVTRYRATGKLRTISFVSLFLLHWDHWVSGYVVCVTS